MIPGGLCAFDNLRAGRLQITRQYGRHPARRAGRRRPSPESSCRCPKRGRRVSRTWLGSLFFVMGRQRFDQRGDGEVLGLMVSRQNRTCERFGGHGAELANFTRFSSGWFRMVSAGIWAKKLSIRGRGAEGHRVEGPGLKALEHFVTVSGGRARFRRRAARRPAPRPCGVLRAALRGLRGRGAGGLSCRPCPVR